MTFSLLAIGEAMAELRQSDNAGFAVGFAGDTFNTAVYCARALGAGSQASKPVGFISRAGYDPLSNEFIAFAQSEQINTDYIARDTDFNLGIYSVSTDGAGERSFHYWRENSAARRLFINEESATALPAAQVVYLSGITLAIMKPAAREKLIEHLTVLRTSGQSLVAFDSNYRPRLWESKNVAQKVTASMWEIADIALPSIDDEMDLFEDQSEAAVLERFAANSRTATAVKRGVQGPVAPSLALADHPRFEPAAQVVDTTAAGDSFNGAYLAAFLSGATETDCLLAGHDCASNVVSIRGAIAPR